MDLAAFNDYEKDFLQLTNQVRRHAEPTVLVRSDTTNDRVRQRRHARQRVGLPPDGADERAAGWTASHASDIVRPGVHAGSARRGVGRASGDVRPCDASCLRLTLRPALPRFSPCTLRSSPPA